MLIMLRQKARQLLGPQKKENKMAFELYEELPSGISGNYWKIISALVHCDDNPVVTVRLSLYVSQAARNQGKQPIWGAVEDFSLLEIDMEYSYDFRACLYHALKTRPKWINAVDVVEPDGS